MATESGRLPTGTSRGAAGAAGVVVREARPDEYEAIGRAVVAAYRAEPVEEIAWYYDEIARVAARAALVPVLAAVDADGTVLGGVTYVPGPGPFAESEAPDEAGFRMLGVDPAHRGRGAGRLLVEACIERARGAGRRRLVLLTRPEYAAARALYERLGFRRDPERDLSPVPGVDLIGYQLDLA